MDKRFNQIHRSVTLVLLSLILQAVMPWTGSSIAADNYLHIEPQVVRAGATANVPIYMTNSDKVVAVQFDITLPFNMPENGTMRLSTRAVNHSASTQATSTAKTYTVVIASMSNKAIKGNSGILLRIPVAITDNGSSSFPVKISNIVLADGNGKNIATQKSCEGTLTVNHEDVPNLTVSNVQIGQNTLTPGKSVRISYTVKNTGKAATKAGWTSKVYMESMTTGERKFIGSQYYGDDMAAGASVTKTLETILPTAMRMDGSVRAVVEIVPQTGCGELLVDQDDNIGYSSTVTLTKMLSITPTSGTIDEKRYWYSKGYSWAQYYHISSIYVTLYRSGDCSVAETFNVASKYDKLFQIGSKTVPTTVTIPAGSSSTSFRIYAVDDNIVRAREDVMTFTPSASNSGYNSVYINLTRNDDDTNSLTLKLSKTEITEGSTITLTATRGGELLDNLEIPLSCTAANRFETLPTLKFAAGQSTCTVELKSINDEIMQLDKDVTFSAHAKYYKYATAKVRLLDDDRPTISVRLSPSVIGENGGNKATTAFITRKGLEKQDIRVRLWTSNDELYPAQNYVTIPAGSTQKMVSVGITDNTNVDGNRTRSLTAAVYIPADGKVAPSGDRARSTAKVEVIDNESPYLTLSSWVNTVGEGSSCRMRVTRHVVSNSGALTVKLASSDTSVKVPASVEIPAGSSYADFTVTVGKNTTTDDDRIVTITASTTSTDAGKAIGKAVYDLRITDRTLPDAAIPSLSFDSNELYSGCSATLTATVRNVGNLVMYKGKTLKFYYSSSYRYPQKYNVTTVYTAKIDKDIDAGDSLVMKFNVTLPDMVGYYWLYAQVENDNATSQEEFSYTNNASPLYRIFVKAPFSCTQLATDKEDYLPGEFIHVTGRVSGKLNGQKVKIDLDGKSQNSSATTTIDNTGYFETSALKVDRSAYGRMEVTAHAIGQTASEKSVYVNVYNMRLYSNSSTTLDCNVDYKQTGTMILQNLSNKRINGIKLSTSALPYGMEISFSNVPSSLEAGQSAQISYTINPKVAYATENYTPFTVKAACSDPKGLECSLTFRYICHATTSRIAFSSPIYPHYSDITTLNTTLGVKSTRTIAVKITNYGLKETGKLALSMPKDCTWAKLLSSDELPSLAPKQSVTVRIQLTCRKDMHSGETYSTQLYASPAIGSPRLLKINVSVVGDEYSKFTLSTEDVYSLANKDYSKLSGGKVTITDSHSGNVVYTGTLGSNGKWTTDKMLQGTYVAEVAVSRHRKVKTEFAVGPGEDKSLSMTVPYLAVVTEFETYQDTETNKYKMISNIDVDYDAPQGIVLPTLAEDGFSCGNDTVDLVMQNVGKYPAYNPELKFANYIDGISFYVVNGFPSVLYPGEQYVAKVVYSGPENGKRRYIGIHYMNYEFTAGSTTLSEKDDYQQLLGCDNDTTTNDSTRYHFPDPMPVPPDGDDDDYSTWIPLPSVNSYAMLTFEDLANAKTGTDITAQLEVKNGSGKEMTKMQFFPVCFDADTDEDLSDFVGHSEGTPSVFTGSTGLYSLSDGGHGILPLTYNFDSEITKNGSRKVIVSGQVAYYCNGMQCTQMLNTYEITLNASGKVKAIYLVQRNYLSDNTETTDKVEAEEPAELVMLVSNEGTASKESTTDVIINNDDLDVVSNATFEAAPYQGVYSSLDGVAGNYDYYNADLGTLTTEGVHTFHWMNVAEEMAHVKTLDNFGKNAHLSSSSVFSFDVEGVYSLIRSVSSKHNQDMTDMAELNVADREYTVQALAKTNAYLLDMQEDENNTPDAVMRNDESIEDLTNVTDKTSVSGGSGTYTLSISNASKGWIYGEIQDPTNGVMILDKVVRKSDGATVAAANFWQTSTTVADDYSSINENLLHFADSISNSYETYTLTYTTRPNDRLQVVSMKAYTADGTEVSNGGTTTVPVKTIHVSFNKAAKNLYANRTEYTVEGNALSLSANSDVVTCLDASTRMEWEVNLKYADVVAGKHEFTVQTEKLKEYKTNIYGQGNSTITWTENFDQKVNLNVSVASVVATSFDVVPGSVDVQSGQYSVGKMKLTATSADGWQFAYWVVNGVKVDCGTTLEYDLKSDTDIKAYFTSNGLLLKFSDPENATIIGNGQGFYTFFTPINLTVSCNSEYCPDYWIVNNQKMYVGQWTIVFNIMEDTEVSVVLKQNEKDGIIEVTGNQSKNDNVYTISGMKVKSQINTPGLYIVNGKKMVIRR